MRKVILHNYLTGTNRQNKFPMKYELEKSLKKINWEMEKASEEFSKLFNTKDKMKNEDYSI